MRGTEISVPAGAEPPQVLAVPRYTSSSQVLHKAIPPTSLFTEVSCKIPYTYVACGDEKSNVSYLYRRPLESLNMLYIGASKRKG